MASLILVLVSVLLEIYGLDVGLEQPRLGLEIIVLLTSLIKSQQYAYRPMVVLAGSA